jgi:hypothetical protein
MYVSHRFGGMCYLHLRSAIYQITWCYSPEDSILHIQHHENLKLQHCFCFPAYLVCLIFGQDMDNIFHCIASCLVLRSKLQTGVSSSAMIIYKKILICFKQTYRKVLLHLVHYQSKGGGTWLKHVSFLSLQLKLSNISLRNFHLFYHFTQQYFVILGISTTDSGFPLTAWHPGHSLYVHCYIPK